MDKVSAARMVAHWPLNESSPPYADVGIHSIYFVNDGGTTPALGGVGIEGKAALLHVDTPPVSTRLFAEHAALQMNSFGFSFWVNPISINPFDNLLAKEMSPDGSVPNDERLAWQVHVLDNNGSGGAVVEFLVRGDDRSAGDFFGAVSSVIAIPLNSNTVDWVHVAGGYNALSGEISLFVNGVEAVAYGQPGAKSSDGGPLVLGSARNGGDLVAFAASVFMEDVQIYDGPLWGEEVAFIRENPGSVQDEDFSIQSSAVHNGDVINLQFNSTCGSDYLVQAATGLADFVAVATHEDSVNLVHDAGTAGPWSLAGIEGSSILLRWNDPPGLATRLFANHANLQSDSFGFSLWVKPHNLNPWDNILAKEMMFDNSIPSWSRVAWQLHLVGDNGFGAAQLELVVRGDNRAVTNFYGLVLSGTTLPLYAESAEWYHIAGGYDAVTGLLRLYVNGQETTAIGIPGARHSDGSPLAIGTVRNGGDAVQFAAVAKIDDVRVYNRSLSFAQVSLLRDWPGLNLEFNPHLVGRWRLNEPSPSYSDSALASGTGNLLLTMSTLIAELGSGAVSNVFFRIIEFPFLAGLEMCE